VLSNSILFKQLTNDTKCCLSEAFVPEAEADTQNIACNTCKQLLTMCSSHWRYGDSAGNTTEENSSTFSQSECTSCHQQVQAGYKTSLQQNSLAVNWDCCLMQAVLYNCHKTVRQDSLHGFPRLFTVISEHICFLLLVFLFLHFLVVGSVW